MYKHIRKDNNTCCYVGKGKGRRINVPKRNKHYNRIRKKYGCYVVKIKENLTEKEAFALEREIIEDYVFVFGYGINIKGYRNYSNKKYLTNCTWGGEGTSGLNPFANKTEEEMKVICEKISEAVSGEKNGMFGRTGRNHPMYSKNPLANKTPEEIEIIRKKNSESHKGDKNPKYWKDKNFSEEHKNNISKSMKGKPAQNRRKVICVTTGKIFDCITDAGKYYNVSISRITQCCKGNRKSAGKLNVQKLVWKYLEDYNNEYKGILINPIKEE